LCFRLGLEASRATGFKRENMKCEVNSKIFR
jgi:hypothetical protein